ncbi:hypothetical protein [Paenarthrobacter sp. C1]|uniref:hypothetical protein n=1 Tax=Paenarthrobacter sp. C1 TaxID=3400220 RepID=UPI003BF5A830
MSTVELLSLLGVDATDRGGSSSLPELSRLQQLEVRSDGVAPSRRAGTFAGTEVAGRVVPHTVALNNHT